MFKMYSLLSSLLWARTKFVFLSVKLDYIHLMRMFRELNEVTVK